MRFKSTTLSTCFISSSQPEQNLGPIRFPKSFREHRVKDIVRPNQLLCQSILSTNGSDLPQSETDRLYPDDLQQEQQQGRSDAIRLGMEETRGAVKPCDGIFHRARILGKLEASSTPST